MISVDMIALYAVIGGQYALLFQIYRMIHNIEIESATCPYHHTGRRPPGAVTYDTL